MGVACPSSEVAGSCLIIFNVLLYFLVFYYLPVASLVKVSNPNQITSLDDAHLQGPYDIYDRDDIDLSHLPSYPGAPILEYLEVETFL